MTRIKIAIGAAVAAASFVATAAAPDPLPAVLVSRQLAESARLHVGDTVTIARDAEGTGGRQFRVAGTYEPTPDPLKFTARRLEARLHLPDLVDVAGAPPDADSIDAVDAINVRLADPNDVRAFGAAVMARAPGLWARPTARAEDGSDPFTVLDRFHSAIAIVTVLGSTAFLLALMVMRAEERRETVGIVRLIGISRRTILLAVLVEGLVIATAGAIFGVLFALATQGAVNHFFQWRYDTALVFVRVTTRIALASVALAVPLGLGAGLVASWTLLRRDLVARVRR
jgi:putative ABC transport system permease protein